MTFKYIVLYSVIFILNIKFDFINGLPNRNYDFYDEVRQLWSLNQPVNIQDDRRSEEVVNSRPDVPKALKDWPAEQLELGQVSGVAVNGAGQPVVFQRNERVFDGQSFNSTFHYRQRHLGPIKKPTVLTLDPHNGKVIDTWGANMFYMPHGLTIDRHDNYWVTDVALHQAFKFKPGDNEPSLIFGKAFEPGDSTSHLCMPAAIAVATTGEIFIADGYCNSRIMKFNAAGGLLRVIPNPAEFLSLQIPHSLALIEDIDRLCIADRENMRVTCPRAGLRNIKGMSDLPLTIQQPDMGKVYAVAAKGRLIYAVNGPTSPLLAIQGLTIDPQTESVIDHWAPEEGFSTPHTIAVSPNGTSLYIGEIGPNRIWKFELVPPKK